MATDPKTYVLAVPGTDETRTLSREGVLGELSRSQITSDYWVWSPEHSDWKQISEIPDLQPPAAKLIKSAPVLAPMAMQPIAQTVVHPASPAPVKKRKVFRRSRRITDHDEGFPYMKFLVGVLYVAVALIIGANYVLVDKSLDEALAHTPFVLVPAHAHLGSFVQPDALVIHILPNPELNQDNFADFLQALAKSTPSRPFQENSSFNMIALTSAWFSQYALSGSDWKFLAGMADATPTDRKDFISDHLCNIAGQPLIRHSKTMELSELKAARASVWQDLTSHFVNR